jgi:hypothetical protein
MQYIGRFAADNAGNMQFDMPGCEIRASLTLKVAAKVTVSLAQKHQPHPTGPSAGGNTKNSGFESNSFVVFVDGIPQGLGDYNATFTTESK